MTAMKLMMTVAIFFSPSEGPLIHRSAKELAWYLEQLYEVKTIFIEDADLSTVDAHAVAAIGSAADKLDGSLKLDALERYVRVEKKGQQTTVLLRGGSDFAVRAAVFRFLEYCGVLFGPLQDFMPDKQNTPDWKPIVIREKAMRPIFGPHYWLNFPMDPSAFTRQQWLRMVQGWSRMGVTTMGYHFYQAFPWYDVQMRDFKDQTGYFFYSKRHPMPDVPELNYAVKNEKTFVSPDIERYAEDTQRMHEWAQETVRQSMALAHKLGMKNSVTFEPYGYDIPTPYKEKMKEWNGGIEVARTDRFHPLVQEYVVSAIRSILKTYPDIDILKLVSGENAKFAGTEEELQNVVRMLVDGDLRDAQGQEVQLPRGQALAVVADALTSCKLAFKAVSQIRQEGALREGLEIAIGCYPGSNFEVHPALFALVEKVVPDKSIKIHFLPAHGMERSAKALELIPQNAFQGRKLEISGWTELDGWMYGVQSWLNSIHRMNQVLEILPVDALYAIQWRVASTTFDNAYFCRSQWNTAMTPEEFWTELHPLFGSKAANTARQALAELEKKQNIAFGFCFYDCWIPLSPTEREGRTQWPFGEPAQAENQRERFTRIAGLLAQASDEAVSRDGKRLADYFANKAECTAIHCGFWQTACRASMAAIEAYENNSDKAAISELLIPYGRQLQNISEDYLKHYQKAMFDRTDEGMLSSYYNTATRYSYRYAHPELNDAENKFYSGPPAHEKKTKGEHSEQLIIAPDSINH